jgi:glycosyltransferase involved in cell wall biosynthesis
MKILLIHNKYKQPGGEDNVFKTESEMLEANGHQVDSILFDNAEIKTLWDKCINGLKSLYNPTSAKIVANKIESFKPDVIHVHNFVPLVSPSVFFVANRYGVPVVLTLHNFRMICPSATLFHRNTIYERSLRSFFPWDAVCKGVYRDSVLETGILALTIGLHHMLGTWKNRVDFYIALTSFSKSKFADAKMGLPKDKILVKPNSVGDCGMGHEIRRDHFLFVGRLVEEKGLRTLLQAAMISKFRLIIIGDGPMREEVVEYTRINPNVVYLGSQNKATVVSHMKACKALIFPSLWYEGLPLTILEAFSAGTPVIASGHGSMKEVIQDKVNGMLFEPGREPDLVRCIDAINNETVDSTMLSQKARETYLRYYTPERNYGMLLTIYNKSIAMKHATKNKWKDKLIHEMEGATG